MGRTLDDAFPSRYLKATDIKTEVTLIIDRVTLETMGNDEEQKDVIHFVGLEKGLVLNRTNGEKIAQITGSRDFETWTGKKVTLYQVLTTVGKEEKPAIRVKAPV
jgi:hypothetical protein